MRNTLTEARNSSTNSVHWANFCLEVSGRARKSSTTKFTAAGHAMRSSPAVVSTTPSSGGASFRSTCVPVVPVRPTGDCRLTAQRRAPDLTARLVFRRRAAVHAGQSTTAPHLCATLSSVYHREQPPL